MKQIPWYMIVFIIIGIIASIFLIITQTNIVYKQRGSTFSERIVLSPDRTEAGYINLKSNAITPSALNWVKFDNGETYILFSTHQGEYIEEKVYFTLPQTIESGEYYIDYYVKYMSGQTETGTLSFTVFP